MSWGADFTVDEEALTSAANEMNELAKQMMKLRKDIIDLLEELKTGFDTPAGRKFYQSCYSGLLTPIDQQAKVMNHIASNLMEAKRMYSDVFDEYREVVTYINGC